MFLSCKQKMTDTIVYWNVKARGWPSAVIAHYGKIPLKWDSDSANSWPAMKDKAPFGQLPVLQVASTGQTIGQSGAQYRILARKAGLEGGNDFDFNQGQQLIEEYQDIYGALAKPAYIQDAAAKAAAISEFREKTAPQHLGYLERLVQEGGTFSQNGRILIGDIMATCALCLVQSVGVKIDAFPKLKAFYEKHHAAILGEFANTPLYASY